MSVVPTRGSAVEGPSGGSIADVVGLILDKGLVIDIYVRVSLIGIEVLTVDARVVVASVDTYLRFAEAAGRVNLESQKPGLPGLLLAAKAPKALDQAPVAPVEEGEGEGETEAAPVPRGNSRKKESAR